MATNPFSYNIPTPKRDGTSQFNFQPPTRTPTDIVSLGDFTFPGISRIEVDRARKARIQTKKKGQGDRLVDSGLELARVKITTRIFFDDEYTQMERIIDYFEHKVGLGKGTEESSFKIDNPVTRIRRVFNVFVEAIQGPFNYQPPGYTEFVFNCIEVVKQKDQTAKTQKPQPQTPLVISTPVAPDFQGLLPSKDSGVTQPQRTTPPK